MKRLFLLIIITLLSMSFSTSPKPRIYPGVLEKLETFAREFNQIPEERKELLQDLAQFIATKAQAGEKAELIFICTHNSRRSHISQIWAQTLATYYQVPNVVAYSGGTEATAFNPRAVKALENVGFQIRKTTEGTNPLYEVRYAEDAPGIRAFSKKYEHEENPKKGFAAIMTCSHADQNCPLVVGASERIAIPYDDPKDFDGTPEEAAKYAERVHQIGREMAYAFSLVMK